MFCLSKRFFLFLFKPDLDNLAFFIVVSTGFISEIYMVDYLSSSDERLELYMSGWGS